MKNRDFFIPSLSTVLVAGMIAFLSCAHQPGSEDDIEDSFSSMVSEEESSNTNQDLASTAPEKTEAEQTESAKAEPEQPEADKAKSDEAMNQQASPEQNNGAQLAAAQEGLTLGLNSDEAPQNTEAMNPSPEVSSNAKENAMSNSGLANTIVQPAPALSIPPAPMKAPMVVAKKVFRVPRIPMKALKRKEGLLNRFYFVRMGDTPESVSKLIYGVPDKGHQLWVSKGRRWAPGRMIYYSSPQNPSDTKMVSFYKEEEVLGKTLKVKRGDWLSKIAQKHLGSPKSWIEIAVMNQVRNPFDLKVGQKLMLFPEIKPKMSPQVNVAMNTVPKPMPQPEPQVATQPEPATVTAPPPAPEVQPRVPLAVEEEKPAKKFSASEYIRELIEKFSNMIRRKH